MVLGFLLSPYPRPVRVRGLSVVRQAFAYPLATFSRANYADKGKNFRLAPLRVFLYWLLAKYSRFGRLSRQGRPAAKVPIVPIVLIRFLKSVKKPYFMRVCGVFWVFSMLPVIAGYATRYCRLCYPLLQVMLPVIAGIFLCF